MPAERGPAFQRHLVPVRIPLLGVLDTAGAVTFLASLSLGFIATLEKVIFVPDVTGAGAGATQGLRIRKGGAAGTILATVTATLANHVMGAAGIAGSVAVADEPVARFADLDTISITKDAGTVFTAAGGTLLLQFRQRPQGRR